MRYIVIATHWYITFFLLIFMISCNPSSQQENRHVDLSRVEDSVLAYNQSVVEAENQEIEDYMVRYHWKMNRTQTGLRYLIYEQGSGSIPREGSVVTIKYQLKLLSGEILGGPGTTTFTFEIGKRKVTSGLEEGVNMMKVGSRAKLIVPSHLAFGILGDMEKVPSRAVLVYDVQLCEVIPSKK